MSAEKEIGIGGPGEEINAGLTRLELAASCVTGMRSNQLNYNPDQWKRSVNPIPAEPKSTADRDTQKTGRYRIRTCDTLRVRQVL